MKEEQTRTLGMMIVASAIGMMLVLSPVYATKAGLKTYTVPNEFSFQYPSNWDIKDRENRFTTIDAISDFATGWMTFEGDFDDDDNMDVTGLSDSQLLDGMKSNVEINRGGSVFESGTDKYFVNNQTAPYVIGTFSEKNILGYSGEFALMVVAVKTNDGVVLVQYSAQQDNFDKSLPKVEKVIQSIKAVGNGSAGVLS